jgi:hypothetical protein
MNPVAFAPGRKTDTLGAFVARFDERREDGAFDSISLASGSEDNEEWLIAVGLRI